MTSKIIIIVILLANLCVNIAMMGYLEDIKKASKATVEELKSQSEAYRNANGFDLDNVPCAVLEAADGIIKCKKKGGAQ